MNYYYAESNITVTIPSRDLRTLARESLAGKWKIAAVGTLVFMAVVSLPSMILLTVLHNSFAADLYTILVTGAFSLGYSVFILNIFRNKEVDYAQIFCGFERILKTMGLYLYICLFVFLWSLLFVIPGIIAAIRYSQSFFILADYPDMPVPEIVNESKRMMRNNKGKYFCLVLSFFGWMILASLPASFFSTIFAEGGIYAAGSIFLFEIVYFVLSAGYLWVTPYVECSLAAMYEIMRGNLRPGVIDTTATIEE